MFHIRALRSVNKFHLQSWRPLFQRAIQAFRHMRVHNTKKRKRSR